MPSLEADISTELDKQIKVLQQCADEHSLEHDEHLEKIQELNQELDEGLASLRNNLGDLADAIADKLANREGQQAASDEVQTSLNLLNAAFEGKMRRFDAHIREQETLLLANKAFLEDKRDANGYDGTRIYHAGQYQAQLTGHVLARGYASNCPSSYLTAICSCVGRCCCNSN
jgi:chromosome segregation ATPase